MWEEFLRGKNEFTRKYKQCQKVANRYGSGNLNTCCREACQQRTENWTGAAGANLSQGGDEVVRSIYHTVAAQKQEGKTKKGHKGGVQSPEFADYVTKYSPDSWRCIQAGQGTYLPDYRLANYGEKILWKCKRIRVVYWLVIKIRGLLKYWRKNLQVRTGFWRFTGLMYEQKSMILQDTGAMSKLLPLSLLKKTGVRAKPTKRGLTVENGYHVKCKGVAKDVPVCSDSVTTSMKCIAVEGVTVDLMIDISEMKRL